MVCAYLVFPPVGIGLSEMTRREISARWGRNTPVTENRCRLLKLKGCQKMRSGII